MPLASSSSDLKAQETGAGPASTTRVPPTEFSKADGAGGEVIGARSEDRGALITTVKLHAVKTRRIAPGEVLYLEIYLLTRYEKCCSGIQKRDCVGGAVTEADGSILRGNSSYLGENLRRAEGKGDRCAAGGGEGETHGVGVLQLQNACAARRTRPVAYKSPPDQLWIDRV